MSGDDKRLIEVAFPLKQASIDSVHEKNVRHGHISTLHIWPARRPLAACRAALICTLLPDPGDDKERKKILEKLAGKVVQKVQKKKMPDGRVVESIKEETEGGILHWGRESGPDLEWFRQEIRKAYGGRAPKVLDPFAGGGAIPLEAMRLGCEATAVDINPVAWFILKCTLEYPQKLAGQKRPLPSFVLKDRDFMESFFKAQGLSPTAVQQELDKLGHAGKAKGKQGNLIDTGVSLEADLAWHVRAWGAWVLERARKDLARFYPVVDGKPTVAYLWARTVKCKNCRATIPLLKTRWLCKKSNKRVILTMEPNEDRTGVVFGIQNDVPVVGGNAAQRREYDRRVGAGTMSRSGATCPCCETVMTMQDIRLEGQSGRLDAMMTAVVVEGEKGKEYRLPVANEIQAASDAEKEIDNVFADIPFGLPEEPTPAGGGSGAGRAFSVQGYGFMKWSELFACRQLRALGIFAKHTRAVPEIMGEHDYSRDWCEAVQAYIALLTDKLVDRNSSQCIWISTNAEKASGSFGRFALPITWDFVEIMPWSKSAGGFFSNCDHLVECLEHALQAAHSPSVIVSCASATTEGHEEKYDAIVTDPPYYDAIPYSDLMDFFYVWLRRTIVGLSGTVGEIFKSDVTPKWNHERNDGELVDDESRFGGDKERSKQAYEDGMFRAFKACAKALKPEGRLVVVFANKQPEAWETLVSAIMRAGFVVDGSWPIQTERTGRIRAQTSAALASSVWLVCKKRPENARPGWDNRVLVEMRQNIVTRLRDFWDAGIRGPDFVWAATGPAMEAYSKHPAVKKANEPGQLMSVSEFLRHVRRIVVDFVVGRVLSGDGESEAVSGLDDMTTYYLLHRHDFGVDDAPAGPCILYAVSCGLSDKALADQYGILSRAGGRQARAADEGEADEADGAEGSGSAFRLKRWDKRMSQSMGYDPAVDSPRAKAEAAQAQLFPDAKESRPRRMIPLIDQVHRLMHLWKAGEVAKVDEYIELRGLRRNALFHRVLQAVLEMAKAGSDERSILENISNHLAARGAAPATRQMELHPHRDEEEDSSQ